MLALGFGQTKHCAASVALAIDVSFAVAEFVSAKLEKSAKSIVFAAASRDVA